MHLKQCLSLFLLVLVQVALSAGCGSPEPFTYVKVAGRVTYDDGSLIEADYITVSFLPLASPLDARTHPRMGHSEVNVEDGTFKSATSHKHGDGLTAGEQIVLVQAFDANMVATDAIPQRYADAETTPLKANTSDSPFHFKIAR